MDDFAAGICSASRSQSIPLVAKPFESSLHPTEKQLRGRGVYPGRLQAADISVLPFELTLHMLDFVENTVDFHCRGPDFSIENKTATNESTIHPLGTHFFVWLMASRGG